MASLALHAAILTLVISAGSAIPTKGATSKLSHNQDMIVNDLIRTVAVKENEITNNRTNQGSTRQHKTGTHTAANHHKDVKHYHSLLLNCTGAHIRSHDDLIEARTQTKKALEPGPAKFNFLKNYKNPCWEEYHDSPDLSLMDNRFFELFGERWTPSKRPLQAMQKRWEAAYEKGMRKRLRCLPYFYVAGVTKCGTTDIMARMQMHPNITAAFGHKEPQWWNRRLLGHWAPEDKPLSLDDFTGLYDTAADFIKLMSTGDYHPVITGEGTPSTLWSSDRWPLLPGNEATRAPKALAPHFIRSYTPSAKIIVLLRNPIHRLQSHYIHNRRMQGKLGSNVGPNFNALVKKDVDQIQNCLWKRGKRECVYDGCINGDNSIYKLPLRAGMYSVFLKDWLDVFPRDQIMVIRFEDYVVDNMKTLNEIFEFLDIGMLPDRLAEIVKNAKMANLGKKAEKEPITDEAMQILQNFYEPFNKELAELLGDDRFLWNDAVDTV